MYAPYGFTALTGQNAASTQAKNMQPGMPGYTGLDSMTFDQMRTPEDQIHWLYLYASNLQLDTINAVTTIVVTMLSSTSCRQVRLFRQTRWRS